MKNQMTENPDVLAMFALLRASLWGQERFPLPTAAQVDWEAVYTELRSHAIDNLTVDLLAKLDPARGRQYLENALLGLSHWYRLMAQQQELCQSLKEAGIPCAVVKGAAVADYYPQPGHRRMGDIDLLVPQEDFDRACGLISQGAEFLGENFRHKEYRRGKVVVEVHQAFSTFRSKEKSALFDGRVFAAIPGAEWITTDGYSFPRLSATENGLTLLEHIDVHLENGLGLRQIIDWMMFVDRELSDPVWHRDFAPFVAELERETLAVTVTRMCQMYLGLREDITWCSGADEALCRELMEYILRQGNFGRKTQSGSNRAASVVNASRNPIALLRILQRRGCTNWGALKRYPWLKPFAWIYQLCRYIRSGLSAEHPVAFLADAIRSSESQSRFLEKLGVSRMEEEGKK